MMLKTMAIILAAALAAPAQATRGAPGDARVRFVDYDPHKILTIYSKVASDTLITFDESEQILDITGGDTEAWGVGVSKKENIVSIKPKSTNPDATIHVITNLRTYIIDMKMAKKNQPNYVSVFYRYPAQADTKRRAATEQRDIARLIAVGSGIAKNRRYTVQGASSISPEEVFDDGTITTFRFKAHGVVPAVYIVGEDGAEKLVEFNGEPNDTLSVHAVSPKFVLRVDKKLVACVYNLAYDPVGVRSTTNTTSPVVERTLKQKAKP